VQQHFESEKSLNQTQQTDTHCASASSISLFRLTESSRRSSNGFISTYAAHTCAYTHTGRHM